MESAFGKYNLNGVKATNQNQEDMMSESQMESMRDGGRLGDSTNITSKTYRSTQQELARQQRRNYLMMFESFEQNLDTTVHVYTQKMEILEKRIHHLEALLKTQSVSILQSKTTDSTKSLFEPLVEKLQQNIFQLTESINTLQMEKKVLQSEMSILESKNKAQNNLVEYLESQAREPVAEIVKTQVDTSREKKLLEDSSLF